MSALKIFIERYKALPESNRRLIILGAREVAGTEDLPFELRRGAALQVDPALSGDPLLPSAVLTHASLRIFHQIDVSSTLPSPWIAGISTFYPQLNGMSCLYGSHEDRAYIRSHASRRAIWAESAHELVKQNVGACWMIDIEGADFEVGRQILIHGECQLLLLEHALLPAEDKLVARALGTALGYELSEDSENICFYPRGP